MKKKIIAILGIVVVISLCAGIYLHASREKETMEKVQQETESTQEEETLFSEELESMEIMETESAELETETSMQEETAETQATEETSLEETVGNTEQTGTTSQQKYIETVPAPAPTVAETENAENTVSESEHTVDDGIDHGSEGDKPGYIYIPGYGYVEDKGGGVNIGSDPLDENDVWGEQIGVMN